MPVDSFGRVADSLKGALAQPDPLLTWNWLTVTVAGLAVAAIFGAIVGSVKWLFPRLGRWKRYRWDQKPLTMFPADYRYKPDVFVNRGDRAEERLRKALAETSGSILIRGPSGVGKSSVLVWLLRKDGIGAYMPTDDDLAHHDMLRTDKSVIVLDNLPDLKRRNRDGDVTYWLQKNQPRVIGLVPDEAYEETRSLLGQFASEARIEPWSETEGRSLADAYGTVFSKADFQNTALSVVAPESHMRRMYERECDSDGRAVLNAIKVVKSLTSAFVPRRVVTLYAERFCTAGAGKAENALRGVEPKWCTVKDDAVMLREGLEPAIGADFSWDSDAWRNLTGILIGKPIPNWCDVAGLMAERMQHASKWQDALDVTERCLTAGCTNPNMLQEKGKILHRLGEPDKAKQVLDLTLSRYRSVRDAYGVAATLHLLGILAQDQGDYAEARRLFVQALALKEKLADKPFVASTLHHLGILAHAQGNWEEAKQYYCRALAVAREFRDTPVVAKVMGQIAGLQHDQGDLAGAEMSYVEIQKAFSELKDKHGLATTLHNLASIAEVRMDYAKAAKLYNESLAIARDLGDKDGIAATQHQLAMLAQAQGDYRQAQALYAESLRLKQELKDRAGISATFHQLGTLAQAQGNHSEAMEFYIRSLGLKLELGDRVGYAITKAQLGQLAEVEGNDRVALRDYTEALAIFEALKSHHCDRVRRDITEMRQRVGDEAFKKLHDEVTKELAAGNRTETK